MSRITAAEYFLPIYLDNVKFLSNKLIEQKDPLYTSHRWYNNVDLKLEHIKLYLVIGILAENYYGTK